MTRHDITPKVDEEDGWHGDDHYTGPRTPITSPRPIPRTSPLTALLATVGRVWSRVRVVVWFLAGMLVSYLVLSATAARAVELKSKSAPDSTVTHVRKYLISRGAEDERAGSVAKSIVRAARKHDVDPALLTAMVTIENPDLKSRARSAAGATGLMQVMPFWRRDRAAQRTCGGSDLTDDDVNLCFGIHVLKFTMRSRQTLPGALLYYNGCRSFRAPCGQYAKRVLSRRSQILATLTGVTEAD